jgi:hypothetical protein
MAHAIEYSCGKKAFFARSTYWGHLSFMEILFLEGWVLIVILFSWPRQEENPKKVRCRRSDERAQDKYVRLPASGGDRPPLQVSKLGGKLTNFLRKSRSF